ncbi:MAG: GNAT family N-acetyltransferase [Bacteroidota bacterium]|nr:GNAT family N-acetyltransferase [Bacteroidota bacterium]
MISLQKFTLPHQPFIEALYRSTREPELHLTNWTEEQKTAFCHMQQFAQLADYGRKPGASHQVILCKKKPVGRLFCWESAEEIRLADISLLPEFRGLGIGRAVLTELMATARRKKKPLTLHVALANPARRLYESLGFRQMRVVHDNAFMELSPG